MNPEATCPNLDQRSDSLTAMSYSSSQNYCRHVTPAAAPDAAHQRKFCLALSLLNSHTGEGRAPGWVVQHQGPARRLPLKTARMGERPCRPRNTV